MHQLESLKRILIYIFEDISAYQFNIVYFGKIYFFIDFEKFDIRVGFNFFIGCIYAGTIENIIVREIELNSLQSIV